MPLKKGYGKGTIGKNIAEMKKKGKPTKQAVAAALGTARTSAKKAGKPGKAPPFKKKRGKKASKKNSRH